MRVAVRAPSPDDLAEIAAVVTRAFADEPHSDGSEPQIVARLHTETEQVLSLLATENGTIVGHIAFSPVTIADGTPLWFGLGPLSVEPRCQRRGIGSLLCRTGLARLRESRAAGCVVLGDPDYYRRFGFGSDARVTFPGVPPAYFQSLRFRGPHPEGKVSYAAAFD